MSNTAQTIIEGCDIPSIPHVLDQILTLANDPNSSIQDVEQLILQEPGLVTHLLKTVNSAYYGFSNQVSSVKHSIFLLGFGAVKSIASGLALIDSFHNLPGLNQDYVLRVWKHSLACAGLVKVLPGQTDQKKQDELFLAAMVHNVGHLVLAQYFQSEYDEFIRENAFPPVEDEQSRFEVDHAAVGAALLEKWRFTGEVVALVRAHHDPGSFEGDKMDIWRLELCNAVSRKGGGLEVFLDQEEQDVEEHFLQKLKKIKWNWAAVQQEKERILFSIDAAQQVITG